MLQENGRADRENCRMYRIPQAAAGPADILYMQMRLNMLFIGRQSLICQLMFIHALMVMVAGMTVAVTERGEQGDAKDKYQTGIKYFIKAVMSLKGHVLSLQELRCHKKQFYDMTVTCLVALRPSSIAATQC